MTDHSGILSDLVTGDWVEPGTGKQYDIDVKDIIIKESLDGLEAELIAKHHRGKSITIISDPFTHSAMGNRIYKALAADGQNVTEYVWEKPSCSDRGVKQIREATRNCDVRIAVGSGTVNDTVKYASYLDKREYSVFATSPMNAYTTGTASVSFDGFKKSITCKGARGVFFDLSVIAKCPQRLISAAFADVICRTTAQTDWLLSNLLFDTPYTDTPYTLLAYDEQDMIKNAGKMLSGETAALAMLTRISAIMGLGTQFTETTHSGSMAEHMISHYIDMFAGDKHPGSSHGEQVGIATITMSLLQNKTLAQSTPPLMHATILDEKDMSKRFGPTLVDNMMSETRKKALDQEEADALNKRFDSDWESIRSKLNTISLPFDTLNNAMTEAGCQRTASELELDTDFYREAVSGARFIRDRFSMLDLVDDSSGLEAFLDEMPL